MISVKYFEKVKRNLLFSSIVMLFLAGAFFVLNLEVTTRQGVNFKVQEKKIPLYLKVIDFMDRHYNYKHLVNQVVDKEDSTKKRVMKLFKWAHTNLSLQPESLPIVDDHVWHIIVRGYGTSDQFSDVFTTLCNYAGANAFFDFISYKKKASRISFAFVKFENKWTLFDPFNGAYFLNKKDDFATILDLKGGRYKTRYLDSLKTNLIDYQSYFKEIKEVDEGILRRANIQSPWNRFLYAFERLRDKLF